MEVQLKNWKFTVLGKDILQQLLTFRDDSTTNVDDHLIKTLTQGAVISDLLTSVLGAIITLASIGGAIYICIALPSKESNVKIAAIAFLVGGGSVAGYNVSNIQPKGLQNMQGMSYAIQQLSTTESLREKEE